MQVAQAREGYELWRPNREKSESKTTKAIIAFVLLVSAGLLAVITIGGWERLAGNTVGVMSLGWAALYMAMAFFVLRWQRGLLPVAAALSVILIIFAAVSAPAWFDRDKPGLDAPLLPDELLGLLSLILIAVQLLLLVVSMVGFNQEWHVEEERPIPGGPYDDSAGGGSEGHEETFQVDQTTETTGDSRSRGASRPGPAAPEVP